MKNIALIIDLIAKAHPQRNAANIHRRTHKVLEEIGEVEEAWLNATSTTNGKGKTWADVREEVVDVMIVATDIGLTPLDGDGETLQADLVEFVEQYVPFYEQNGTYDNLILGITKSTAMFGLDHHKINRRDMIVQAFALVDLIWREGTVHRDFIVSEVRRKLAKWIAARDAGAVVSDNQDKSLI